MAANRQIPGIQAVRRNQPGAHWTERVDGFTQKPLTMLLLQIAGGHVVHNGVAVYMPPGVGAGDIFAPFADDDREFGFVIELGGNPGVSQNRVDIRHYRAWRFGENNGNRGSVLAILRRRIKRTEARRVGKGGVRSGRYGWR